jgi:hypothetical protein
MGAGGVHRRLLLRIGNRETTMPAIAMRTVGVALLAALPTLTGTVAWAGCGPMTLQSVPGTYQLIFSDLDGSGGPTAGDKRTGENALSDADGTPVGTLYWVNTVRAVAADGTPSASEAEAIFAFQDGAVFVTGLHQPAAVFDREDTTVLAPVSQYRIHSGTGAYAGAGGTVEVTADGTDFAYAFDLVCE